MMCSFIAKCAVVAASFASGALGFSVPPTSVVGSRQTTHLAAATSLPQQQHRCGTEMAQRTAGRGQSADALPMSRKEVLGAAFGMAASSFAFVAAADAKDDPALKGTKADPEFVTCLSECIYYCTKSKEQTRSRQECIPECRQTCAKTKAQGMIGSPRE